MAEDEGADLRLVLVVHKAFRGIGEEMADGLTAQVDCQDAERIQRIADVWDFFTRSLVHHHEGEDEVIWPRVTELRPDFSTIEQQMEKEHGEIDGLLEPAVAAVAAMRKSCDPATVKAAADAIRACVAELDEHLGREEAVAFPVVHDTINREEFDAMGEKFFRSIPKADLPFAAASLDEWARKTPEAERPPPPPLPVRVLLALSWRRKFRKFVAPLREAS
jgi:hemerythrin-like domain-containing protein